jgi:hypothetical protein
MIQRIQSIFFALAGILSILMFVLPLFSMDVLGVNTTFRITEGIPYGVVLSILAGATIGLPFATIFQYKNRPLQSMLALINQLLLVGLLVSCVLSFDSARNVSPDIKASAGPAMFFPIAAIILTMLARRAVKKDEALVRSADRIR